MTIDEAIKDLEYGTEQLEMEIESGLWIKGSESELRCKEGIALNKQRIEWLTELKELRKLTIINPIIAGYNEIYEELRKGDIEASNDKDLLKTAIDTLENVMPKYRRLSEENQKQKEQIAEYKRLLKAAVEDFKEICVEIFSHKYCKWYSNETDKCIRPDDTTCEQVTDWKHADEAEKLIGGSEND